MAKGFEVFPLWLDDWWGSTARKILSPAGRAAYLELLMAQYSMGGSRIGSRTVSRIPSRIAADDEQIAKLIGFTIKEWVKVKGEVLPFLERTKDGGLSHPKVAKEVIYKLGKIAGGKARAAQQAAERPAERPAERQRNGQPSSSSLLDEDEDPQPPQSGGGVSSKRGRKKNPRELGTNPRALGTNPRTVAKTAEAEEKRRRLKLIAAIERRAGTRLGDGTEIEAGGIYDAGSGTMTWGAVATQRLEAIVEELGE